VVVKCAASTGEAAAVKQRLAARFPEQRLVVVSAEALSGSGLLYAQLALAKQLYGDWYTDVDLSTVAAELGVSENVISF
jgi:trimethylamine:corrinoid methyltransferase-like protein